MMNERQIKRYFANKKRFEKQGYQNEMDRDEIIGRALSHVDDRRYYERIDGRYGAERRARNKILAKKHSDEATNYMNLAYKFNKPL